MIVELPGNPFDSSFGRIKHYKMGFFHFSNNNLSIRKACAKDLGRYDPQASKSEDVDICFRLAQSRDWVAVREKGNFVRHKARKSFPAFVKQIWGWGYHLGYPYAKTGIRGFYLYWINSKDHKISFDLEIGPFPLLVCLFLTDFHVLHLLIGAALLAGVLGQSVIAAIALLLSLPFIWRYLYDERQIGLGFWTTCRLALTHYIANVVFSLATFGGALRHRVLLIPSSIFQPKSLEDV
jgi:hypothetical protein